MAGRRRQQAARGDVPPVKRQPTEEMREIASHHTVPLPPPAGGAQAPGASSPATRRATAAHATLPGASGMRRTGTPGMREQLAAGTSDSHRGSSGESPTIPHARVPVTAATSSARQLAPRAEQAPPPVLIRGAARPRRPAAHIVPRRNGPRSAAAQFVGAMVVAVALISAVTLASPLGQTVGISSTFQVYANAISWIPTPTPSPTPRPTPVPQVVVPSGPPHYANPGTQAIVNEIVAVFGPYAQGALNIARCESGYDPNAWNPFPVLGSHASGVFQILYPITWNGTSYARYSPYNADDNIRAAYEIFRRDGYSWREWECKPY
ncbi:MAG: hypothetical protein IVW57_04255 [Ktedonobacterales bacterium]|nr:hypothetical protein [Ktedonobacterales bacterium]